MASANGESPKWTSGPQHRRHHLSKDLPDLPTYPLPPSAYPPRAGELRSEDRCPPCFLMAHPGLTSIMTDSPFRHPSAWFNRFRTEFFKCLVIPRSAATSHESSVARPQLLRLTCPRQYLISINPLVFRVDLAIRLYHYSHLCRLFISHDNAHLAQTRLPGCLPQPSLAQTQLSDPLSYTCRLSTIGQVHPPGR